MSTFYIICKDRNTGEEFAVTTRAADSNEAVEKFIKARGYHSTPLRYKRCAILGAVGGALAATEAEALQYFENQWFGREFDLLGPDDGAPLTRAETAQIYGMLLFALVALAGVFLLLFL